MLLQNRLGGFESTGTIVKQPFWVVAQRLVSFSCAAPLYCCNELGTCLIIQRLLTGGYAQLGVYVLDKLREDVVVEVLIVLVDCGSTVGLLADLRMEVLHQLEGLLAKDLRNLQTRLRDVWQSGIANGGKSGGDQQRRWDREFHFESKVWLITSESDGQIGKRSDEMFIR